MLKIWKENLHTDQHGRQLIEMVPQGDTPGGSRFVLLFNLILQEVLPNGQEIADSREIRHEVKAESLVDAYAIYAREMAAYGARIKEDQLKQARKIVVPNMLPGGRFNGGRKPRGGGTRSG